MNKLHNNLGFFCTNITRIQLSNRKSKILKKMKEIKIFIRDLMRQRVFFASVDSNFRLYFFMKSQVAGLAKNRIFLDIYGIAWWHRYRIFS